MLQSHEILGVPENATRQEIDAAYNRKMMHTNPDNFTEGSIEKEKAIQKRQTLMSAYDNLSSTRTTQNSNATIPKKDEYPRKMTPINKKIPIIVILILLYGVAVVFTWSSIYRKQVLADHFMMQIEKEMSDGITFDEAFSNAALDRRDIENATKHYIAQNPPDSIIIFFLTMTFFIFPVAISCKKNKKEGGVIKAMILVALSYIIAIITNYILCGILIMMTKDTGLMYFAYYPIIWYFRIIPAQLLFVFILWIILKGFPCNDNPSNRNII